MRERALEVLIASWTLIPSRGGVFEVTVNDKVIFSKKQAGRHALTGEIRELLLEEIERHGLTYDPSLNTRADD